jgi:hypothetical protein
MMNIRLFHGRSTPDEEIDESLNGGWGFDGPILTGVESFSWTYNTTLRIYFVDEVSTEKAADLTGWNYVPGCQELWMDFYEDMIHTRVNRDGEIFNAYYGDFSMYPTPTDEDE